MNSPLQNEMILASAGSGKTWQLTNRYIAIMGQALLAGDEVRPERIVAVTFTRKAAGEFFESILQKLAGAALDERVRAELISNPEDSLYPILSQLNQDHYVQLLSIFLRRMPSLFLGTLDSFFSNILRSFPAEFGLTSQFEILDDHAARTARQDVYREVFRSGQDQHRNKFLEAFKRATFGQEEVQVVHQLDRFVSRHHEIFLHASQLPLWGDPASIWPKGSPWGAVSGNPKDDFKALFDLFAAEELSDGQWDYWKEFRDQALLHSPGNPMARRIKFFLEKFLLPENWSALKAGEVSFAVNRRKQNFTGKTCELIHRITSRLVADEIEVHLKRTQGIWHILNQYEEYYASLVRRRGQLTFRDLEIILSGCDLHDQSAPILSQKPGELDRLGIDYRLDGRFDHWLLDEFQDTSYLQWSIIEPLIDEALQDVSQQRSLFQVGDMKQAIYSWRGGDTRLFDDIYERYRGSGEQCQALQKIPLNVSWRSGPDVIGMVNRVFGDTDALANLELPAEVISRWEWRPHEVAHTKEDLAGFAALYEPIPTEEDRVTQEDCFALALELLERIQPIRRGLSCAILVQDNRTGRALVDYLRAHTRSEIPVAGEADISPALDNPVTQALLGLIRVAAHPADRYSWQNLSFGPLAALLPDTPGQLSSEILNSLHYHGYEHTLRAWITRLNSAKVKLDAFGSHRADELALAARIFDQSGNRSPDNFLRFAEDYTVREVTTSSAVQVMTIHKSKGLTFDAVILPQLEGDSLINPRRDIGIQRDPKTRKVQWVFDTPRRVIADTDPVLMAYRRDQEAEAGYEELCKFYVALTRAKHANYLIVPKLTRNSHRRNFIRLLHETIVEDSATPVEFGQQSALALFESSEKTTDAQWYEQFHPPTEEEEEVTEEPVLPQLVSRERPRRLVPSAHDPGSLQGGSLFSREGNRARNHGTLVHALLEDLEWLDDFDPHTNPPGWEIHRCRNPHAFEAARHEVEYSLASPSFANALRKPDLHPDENIRCWRERPYELLRDGNWISGIFDRVHVISELDGRPVRATILDFKTDRVEDESDASLAAERYRPQMETYRHALAQLLELPASSIDTLLMFTRIAHAFTLSAD